MSDIKNRNAKREARHVRLRRKVKGTAERPRLVVFKSAKHIYAQLVDDAGNRVLSGVSDLTPDLKKDLAKAKGMDVAKAIGKAVAALAKKHNIEAVVFDRGGFPYIGRVKALAEAARAEGLKF